MTNEEEAQFRNYEKQVRKTMVPMKSDLDNSMGNKLVDSDLDDYIRNNFLLNRITKGLGSYGDSVRVEKNALVNVPAIVRKSIAENDTNVVSTYIGDWLSFIVSDNVLCKIHSTSNSVKIHVMGDEEIARKIIAHCHKELPVVAMTVDWVTNTDMNTVSIPLVEPKGITDSSYPFIEEGVDAFVEEYLSSSENVLVLIGPPGTGKSSLIQYIIAKSKRNAMITYDPVIMNKDDIFANFIESDAGSFIMEDADTFLASRTEGNISMHKFLNVSSGIVSMAGKKLIFSTNLESADEIDSALLRPGRCFGLIHFRKLTSHEANDFLQEHGFGEVENNSAKYSLAELYNMTSRNRKPVKKASIGFV